jgi:predicted DNA-binding transcriptional regulator AlpA
METNDTLELILLELRTGNADKRLWSMDDIATYLNTSKSTVQTRIVCKPDFPTAITIPTQQGHTNRRWYPGEVKNWIGKHRDSKNRRGRPRVLQSV